MCLDDLQHKVLLCAVAHCKAMWNSSHNGHLSAKNIYSKEQALSTKSSFLFTIFFVLLYAADIAELAITGSYFLEVANIVSPEVLLL